MGDDDKLEVNPPNTSEPPRETVRPRPNEERRERASASSASASSRTTSDRGAAPATAESSGKPVILAVLYLSSLLVGLTGLVALILAIVWKSEPHAAWETSHYDYQIRTFVIWLVEVVLATFLIITIIGALIGIPLAFASFVHLLVRCIMSLIRASNREPMPNPGTWLA